MRDITVGVNRITLDGQKIINFYDKATKTDLGTITKREDDADTYAIIYGCAWYRGFFAAQDEEQSWVG